MAESVATHVFSFGTMASMVRAAAEAIVASSHEAFSSQHRFTITLSGGSTPKPIYELLATEYSDEMNWPSTHLFFGDERYVPKDHPESNYAMVHESMISRITIPNQNVHPVPIDLGSPDASAESYDLHLKEFLLYRGNDPGWSSFDLVILGIGADGHIASLFAGSTALDEHGRLAMSVRAPPKYKTIHRITFSLEAINRAKEVVFLASGTSKRDVIRSILEGRGKQFPAAMVRPRGPVTWFITEDIL